MATAIKYWTIGCKNGVVSPTWDNKSFSDVTQVIINDDYILLSSEKDDRSFTATPLYSVQTFIGWRDVNSGSLLANHTTLDIDTLAYTTGSDGNRYYNIQAEFAGSVEAEKKFYPTTTIDYQLVNKADKTLSNVTYPTITAGSTTTGIADRVIKQYMSSDGLTWYRVWASGWKECGLKISASSWGNGTYTLPITFSNSNYSISVAWQTESTNTNAVDSNGVGVTGKTTTSISAYSSTTSPKWIYCCGY